MVTYLVGPPGVMWVRLPPMLLVLSPIWRYAVGMSTQPYDVVGAIMDYEGGDIQPEAFLELFSHLVKTGQAWSLQGTYGRTAHQLIDTGYLDRTGKILKHIGEEG